MDGRKIPCPKDGRYKINSPKGRANGKLNIRYKINSPKGRANGKLNIRHANNSPKGWIAQK